MVRKLWLGQLDRYFFRLHLTWMAGCTMVLMIACYIFEFSELLRKHAVDTQTNTLLLGVFGLMKLPDLLYKLLPFIALFANLLCFRSLKASNQLLIARGSGRSMVQILKPFLLSTFLMSTVSLVGINPLATWCLNWLDLHTHPQSQWTIQPTEQGLWILQENIGRASRMIRIGHGDASATHVEDVSIFEYESDAQPMNMNRIEAASGQLESHQSIFSQVYNIQGIEQPSFHEVLILKDFIDGGALMRLAQDTQALPIWVLPSIIKKFEILGLDTHRFFVHLNVLLSKNILMFCLVFLSAVFMMRSGQRTKGHLVFVTAAVMAFILYLFSDILHSMTLARRIGVWSLWIPAELCALAAVLGMTYEKKTV